MVRAGKLAAASRLPPVQPTPVEVDRSVDQ
jgi:hypothetical protein